MSDFVKRQDAIDTFLVGKNTFAGFCTIEQAIENIESVESADVVEVRHGRWLPQKLLGERMHDCSECKTLGSPVWRYCPVCGTKMDGKGEGE